MIPIKDTIPSRSFPVMNWILIGLNTAAFLLMLSLTQPGAQRLIFQWGVVPIRLVNNPNLYNLLTIFSSMFLYGGWAHLLSNMLALFIFGDNIEDRMGHLRYLGFYLIAGTAAVGLQVFFNRDSSVPMVGASGAISGILAAYLVLFPRARVVTLFLLFFLPFFVEIPAVIFLGGWFLLQLLNGLLSVGGQNAALGGVAYWAHIGGFASGLLFVFIFARRRKRWEGG